MDVSFLSKEVEGMKLRLKGIKIAVLGGDRREIFLIPELVQLGAVCQTVGLPIEQMDGVKICKSINEAVDGVQAIILPMPGTNPEGKIHAVFAKEPLYLTEEAIKTVSENVPIIVGVAKPFLKKLAIKQKLQIIEIAEKDDLAILNSIPSAEGAIQIAMEETLITIHGSKSYVLGYGRCGITLARMLKGLGANTTVVARKPADIARAIEAGMNAITFSELADNVTEVDIIFNTVPVLVLDEVVLKRMSADTVIIDIASSPGGTDFQAAAQLGIKAILAPGLPGKIAPKSAGLILAKVIPNLIIQEVSGK